MQHLSSVPYRVFFPRNAEKLEKTRNYSGSPGFRQLCLPRQVTGKLSPARVRTLYPSQKLGNYGLPKMGCIVWDIASRRGKGTSAGVLWYRGGFQCGLQLRLPAQQRLFQQLRLLQQQRLLRQLRLLKCRTGAGLPVRLLRVLSVCLRAVWLLRADLLY